MRRDGAEHRLSHPLVAKGRQAGLRGPLPGLLFRDPAGEGGLVDVNDDFFVGEDVGEELGELLPLDFEHGAVSQGPVVDFLGAQVLDLVGLVKVDQRAPVHFDVPHAFNYAYSFRNAE